MKYLLFLAFFLSMASCYMVERKYYYDKDLIKKIKKVRRNHQYTYIDFQLPKPGHDEVKAYLNRKIEYRFKEPRSADKEMIFALVGRSTMNFGVLERVENGKRIQVDSVSCDHGEFLLLKLKPAVRGDYKIRAWGCRYGKEFDIVVR